MVEWFSKLSLKAKTVAIDLVITSLLFLIALGLFSVREISAYRTSLINNLQTLAEVLGYNAAAPLTFADEEAAHEMLVSLKAEDSVLSCAIYSSDETKPFAIYRRTERVAVHPLGNRLQELEPRVLDEEIVVQRPILAGGERVGTLLLSGDLRPLYHQLKRVAIGSAALFVLFMLAAISLTVKLQKLLTAPILTLVSASQAVSRTGDFSIRAHKSTDDEVGYLVDTFNSMLDQLEARGKELEDHRASLEEEVRRRTEELATQNMELAKARDAAEEVSRAKSSFLANMSHEIRTPLNGLLGMAEIVLESPLSPDQRECVDTLHHSGTSLLSIVNDILDFSKIESGKLDLEKSPVSLRKLIYGTGKTFSAKAAEQNIELICHVAPDVPDEVLTDAHRIRQILINLLGNSLKFTESGYIVVRATAVVRSRGAMTVLFEIEDSGIGISAGDHKKIFESFAQADPSITRKHGGTGLGLTISSRLVALMGGTLQLRSEVGKGSTFYFTLPIALEAGQSEEPVRCSPALLKTKVGLADPSERSRKLTAEIINGFGFTVQEIDLSNLTGTTEAGAAVLLLDLDDPRAAAAVLSTPIGSTSPVVLGLSRPTRRDTLPPLLRERLAKNLVKPVEPADLLESIQSALGFKEPVPLAATSVASPGQSTFRVLVAEDNTVNQRVVRRLLERVGHSVEIAETGVQAINLLEQRGHFTQSTANSFDLVLMDIQMPEMGGLEATQAIRERERQCERYTPIVALTAHAMEEHRAACFAAGMDGCVTKPIDTAVLAVAMEQAVAHAASYSAFDRRTKLGRDRFLLDKVTGRRRDILVEIIREVYWFRDDLCRRLTWYDLPELLLLEGELASMCPIVTRIGTFPSDSRQPAFIRPRGGSEGEIDLDKVRKAAERVRFSLPAEDGVVVDPLLAAIDERNFGRAAECTAAVVNHLRFVHAPLWSVCGMGKSCRTGPSTEDLFSSPNQLT